MITFTLLTLYKCDTFIEEYNLMFATWHYSALLCASLCWGVARHGRHLKCWGLLASQYNINIYSIHFWHYTTVTLFLRISLDVSIMHCHFTLFKIAVCNLVLSSRSPRPRYDPWWPFVSRHNGDHTTKWTFEYPMYCISYNTIFLLLL